MRVITGTARGRRLGELKGMETRPTAAKVKEGLFSAIQFEIEGRRTLDLFAGTGQLGIEALSRGAAWCDFVDRSKDAAELVRQNVAACRLAEHAQVFCMDAMAFLERARTPYDLIFLDPPYAHDSLEEAMERIVRLGLLSSGGILAAEHAGDKKLPSLYASRTYRYGKTCLTVYRAGGEEDVL